MNIQVEKLDIVLRNTAMQYTVCKLRSCNLVSIGCTWFTAENIRSEDPRE